jgi:hypothetical protein
MKYIGELFVEDDAFVLDKVTFVFRTNEISLGIVGFDNGEEFSASGLAKLKDDSAVYVADLKVNYVTQKADSIDAKLIIRNMEFSDDKQFCSIEATWLESSESYVIEGDLEKCE